MAPTPLLLLLSLASSALLVEAFMSPLAPGVAPRLYAAKTTRQPSSLTKEEKDLLDSIQGLSRREAQNAAEAGARVRQAIAKLEAIKGIRKPTRSPVIEGKWKLLFTSQDNTASPIQKGVVGNDAFTVYQLIDLSSREPTVTNLVDFAGFGELPVRAQASTASRPIPGFVPRRGDGRILGMNLFGVSQSAPPEDPDMRIDFAFTDAAFDLKFMPFPLPYPVPFRLLGDEAKGYIDTTYMSENVRISRGNKGTTFVLQKVF